MSKRVLALASSFSRGGWRRLAACCCQDTVHGQGSINGSQPNRTQEIRHLFSRYEEFIGKHGSQMLSKDKLQLNSFLPPIWLHNERPISSYRSAHRCLCYREGTSRKACLCPTTVLQGWEERRLSPWRAGRACFRSSQDGKGIPDSGWKSGISAEVTITLDFPTPIMNPLVK